MITEEKGVSFNRCYEQLGDGKDIQSGCYGYAAAYAIAFVAFIIIGCSNYCKHCPNGLCGKKGSDKKNKPCACMIATIAGMGGVALIPLGVAVYIFFAPFTCCCKKDDDHKNQKCCHDCAVKMRDFAKWLMKAPVKIGNYLGEKCPM